MIREFLVETFQIFPPEVSVFLISMIPVAELRGAIPVGLTIYELDVFVNYAIAVLGNIIPAFFIVYLLGPVSGYLTERFSLAEKFFGWLFNRTRHKLSGKYEKWGMLALTLFVAVPLPVTGAWTGSVAAFIFGMPKKTSIFFIGLGVLISGIIVTLLTLGVISIF